MMNDEPKRASPLETVLTLAIVLAVGVGSGMFVKGQLDDSTAQVVAAAVGVDRQRERDAATKREAHLTELLESERKDHEENARDRHTHYLAFTAHAAGVRNDLETRLDASRRAGDACTARIDGISADAEQLSDLLGQSVGLLKDGRAEDEKLRAENERLAKQVKGWQQFDQARRVQRVVVTAPKR